MMWAGARRTQKAFAFKSVHCMATHSSILAWKIPWMEEPGRLQSMGRKESDTTERLTLFLKDTNTGLSLGHATWPAYFLQRSP